MVRGKGIDDAVGANLFWIVGQDRHSGLDTGLDDDGGDSTVIAVEHQAHLT